MADSTESSLQIVDQTTGGNDGTWGNIEDANNTKFVTAIAKTLDLTGLTGGTRALSDDENRNAIIEASGTLASNQIVTVNAAQKWWHVVNNTTGSFTLTVKTSAGSGVTIPQSGKAIVYCDGTDVIKIIDTDRVDGLGTVVDNRLVRTNGTGGTTLQQTGITVDDNEDMSGGRNIAITGTITADANVAGVKGVFSGIVGKADTSGVVVPAGTVAERSGTENQLRVNTDYISLEGYFSGAWRTLSVGDVVLPVPQGYLGLRNGNHRLTSSDLSNQGTVYYNPKNGLLVPIHNGTFFIPRAISGTLSLVLNASSHLAGRIYDIWLDHNSGGAVRIGTGPAWSDNTAGACGRGGGAGTTEHTTFQGLTVNANSMTVVNDTDSWTVAANQGLYIGTIRIGSTAAKVACLPEVGQSRRWDVWNPYNQEEIILQVQDPNSTWVLSAGTSARASRNDATNTAAPLIGLDDGRVSCDFNQNFNHSAGTSVAEALIGIGVDSTSTRSGRGGTTTLNSSTDPNRQTHAEHVVTDLLGFSDIYCLESNSGGGGVDMIGATGMLMIMRYMG